MFRWPSSVSCGWSPASGGPGPRCTCTGVGGYALGCVTRLLPGPSGSSGRKKVSPASPHSPRPSLGSCSCGPVTLPIPAQRGHLGGPQRRLSIPRTSDVAACFRGGCRDGVPWTGRSAHSKGTLRTWGHQSRTASEWRFPPSHRTPRVASNTRSRRLSWSGPCRTAWPGTSGLGQRVHPGCRKRPWGLVQGRLPAQPPSPAASVRSHLPVTRFPEGVGGVTSPALRHCAITRGHRRRRRRPRRNSLQMETSLSAFRRGSLLGIHTLVSHLPPRPHF